MTDVTESTELQASSFKSRMSISFWGGENTTQNLGSCQKVIPRRNIIIETAFKIINKQGKSVMLEFFLTNCSDLCQ